MRRLLIPLQVLDMLEANMTDKQLKRFLSVMVDNLVDSNVFMRSLVLSVEHSAFRLQTGWDGGLGSRVVGRSRRGIAIATTETKDGGRHPETDMDEGDDSSGNIAPIDDYDMGFQGLAEGEEPCYLGHTWFDVQPRDVKIDMDETDEDMIVDDDDDDRDPHVADLVGEGNEDDENGGLEDGEVWSWARDTMEGYEDTGAEDTRNGGSTRRQKWSDAATTSMGVDPERRVEENKKGEGDGRRGCAGLASGRAQRPDEDMGEGEDEDAHGGDVLRGSVPGSPCAFWGPSADVTKLTRLQGFLKQNTPQLVRDLMGVVNLETINHENICCLNTAVLILIFADRRGHLAEVRTSIIPEA